MYGNAQDGEQHCTEIRQKALSDNRYNQNWEYEFIDDRRSSSEYQNIISLVCGD